MSGEERRSCSGNCLGFLKSPPFKLYASYAFSTWGDRMWSFALSIALYSIGGNLRLPAATGFANGFAVLIFGAAVGKWIDKTPRLKAAQVSLTLNNIAVALSAGFLVALTHWTDEVDMIWNGELRTVLITLSIVLCAISVLAGTGTKICVTKDWVVVMCKKDKNKLASMNAMLLRIDLTAMIISPLVAGQIMTSVSIAAGCMFIGIWNVCSYGVEFVLLLAVYRSVPELSLKVGPPSTVEPSEKGEEIVESAETPETMTEGVEMQIIASELQKENPDALPQLEKRAGKISVPGFLQSLISGWKAYFRQSVLPAGLGLALLYLTVMGLDGITSGYAYSQGIQENVLAGVRGAGALVGISGSFCFPRLRKRIGLERTGLVSLVLELSALCLAVSSIWLPGSPFDLASLFNEKPVTNGTEFPGFNQTNPYWSTVSPTSSAGLMYPDSMCSIWAFLSGIVLARFGLWCADLSITQIMQEHIAEHERGVVFAVQSAINQLMALLKDTFVIFLPEPRTFGLLIIVSWLSVFGGFISYCTYSRRIRGHLLPFHGDRFKDVQFVAVEKKPNL